MVSLKMSDFELVILGLFIIINLFFLSLNMLGLRVLFLMLNKSHLRRTPLLMINITLSHILLDLIILLPSVLVIVVISGVSSQLITLLIIQSFANYLNAISRIATTLMISVLSCDQYLGITRVFQQLNPLNRISNKIIIIGIWFSSLTFSLPFLVTSEAYYFDYNNHTLVCIHSQNYLKEWNTSLIFKKTTRITRITLQYVIPSFLFAYLTIKLIFHFMNSKPQLGDNEFEAKKIPAKQKKWIVLKFVFIFIIFIVTNSGFHINSFKNLFIKVPSYERNLCPYLTTTCYLCYLYVSKSILFFSIVYLLMNKCFMKQLKVYLKSWKLMKRDHSIHVFEINSRITH